MATRTQVIERFAASTWMNPMTLERIMRVLSDENMVPKGGPGGRKRSAHFSAEHLKNVILALAAPQPSDAAGAVQALDELWFSPLAANNVSPRTRHAMRFGDWLVQEIETLALQGEASHNPITGLPPPEITMSLAPAYAWTSEPLEGADYRRREIFNQPEPDLIEGPKRSIRRLTTISIDLLLVASSLLADTLAKQATPLIPNLVPGRTGEGKATPETTKAAGPGSHSGLQSGQPALAAQTEPLDKAQSTAGEGSKQLYPISSHRDSQVRHQPVTARTRRHGTHWTDTASAQAG